MPPVQTRVLFGLNYYAPYISGLSEYARLLAEGLVERGYQVTVLTGQHASGLPLEEARNGVRVVRARVLVRMLKGYLSPHLIAKFRSLVTSADLVHFHAPMLEAGWLARLTPSPTPLVVTHHCDLVPQGRGGVIERAAVSAVRASSRAAFRRARAIAVTSEDYAKGSEDLRGFLPKCRAIAPPDNASESPPSDRPPGHCVGFLGRFVAEKGIEVLLDAVPLVLAQIPDTRFLLAGNYSSIAGGSVYGKLKGRLEALHLNVETPGQIPDAELSGFYRSLDVFVLPSVDSYEAFGIVQLEAMKAGAPVIATDMRGVRVPIQETGNGLLVPPRDAPALARAIIEVLTVRRFDPHHVAQTAWSHFPKARPINQTIDLYEDLLKGGVA